MSTLGRRHLASKRLLFLVAAACLLGAATAGSSAAAPIYTDWTAPVSLGAVVNSSVTDSGPALSPDGLSLFFYSNRAGGLGANDIWVTQRPTVNDPWGPPINVGAPLNSTVNDQLPSLSEDGHWMIISSARTGAGGFGGPDLYQSYRADIHDDFGWETPTNLGSNVNSTAGETGNAYFANGGHPQVYFGSDRLAPAPGGGVTDLYVTTLQADGTWGLATLVPELNSTATENRPTIRIDGLEIFFYSDRTGGSGLSDLWTAARPSIDAAWSTPTNLGAIVNSSATDVHPGLSADAKTLIFGSTRVGALGGNDLYMTTRAQIFPATKDECKTGGWERFGIYKNQGDCVSYVATNGENPPG